MDEVFAPEIAIDKAALKWLSRRSDARVSAQFADHLAALIATCVRILDVLLRQLLWLADEATPQATWPSASAASSASAPTATSPAISPPASMLIRA